MWFIQLDILCVLTRNIIQKLYTAWIQLDILCVLTRNIIQKLYTACFTMWQGLYHVTGPLLCDRAVTMWQGLYHVTGPLPCDRAFTVPLIFYSFIVDRSLMSFQSRFIYIRYLQMQYFIIDALHTYCQWIFWEYIYLYKIPSWTEIIDHTKHIYFRKCQNIC